jgi:arylsulfatase A-like enzyme
MNRREFIKLSAGVAALASFCPCSTLTADSTKKKRPNIIYINTDDWGIGKVPAYGFDNAHNTLIKTPNLNQLAADGMRFTNAYSGNAVCGPSRCSLLTGRHPGHAIWRANSPEPPHQPWPPKKPMLGTVARQAGYTTAAFGKVSAGGQDTPENITGYGWDYWLGFLGHVDCRDYYSPVIWENGKQISLPANNQDALKDTDLMKNDNGVVGEGKGTFIEDLYADKIIEFITANKDKPFFVYFASTVPHGGRPGGLRVPALEGYDQYENLSRAEQVYCAMLTRHDRNVGRIRNAVEKLGLADNTIIMWTSDNGDENSYYKRTNTFDGNGPYRNMKRSLYEGGIRAPLIAWWPGHIKAGSTCSLVTAQWDLMPTMADAGGQSAGAYMDGISILPTLVGRAEEQTKREYLYWEFSGSQQAVRMSNWKAYRKGGPGNPTELYRLDLDVGERRDIADQHPDIVAKAEKIMRDEHTYHPDSEKLNQKHVPGQPNFLLVFVDDMGWRDWGGNANPYVVTPNIDRLAEQAVVFEQGYVNAANCAPSRCALLTGQYPPRTGFYAVNTIHRAGKNSRARLSLNDVQETVVIAKEKVTFAEALKKAGYRTAMYGKWHVGGYPKGTGILPDQQGFDDTYVLDGLDKKKLFAKNKDPKQMFTCSQRAMDFAEKSVKEGKPFMIYLAHQAPHVPKQYKPESLKNIQNRDVENPLKTDDGYAAMVYDLDASIGLLLDKLDALKIRDNTVVIFLSDNGAVPSVTTVPPLRAYKGAYYEGGIRVPYFISWTGHFEPATNHTPVSAIDLYPTMLELAGVKDIDAHLEGYPIDGESLVPLLKGQSMDERALYWHFPGYLQRNPRYTHTRSGKFRAEPVSVIRRGDWKLMMFMEEWSLDGGREKMDTNNAIELYNLKDDISEQHNLALKEPEIRDRLLDELLAWQKNIGAPIPKEPANIEN